MKKNNNLFSLLQDRYSEMSKGQKQITDYILDNYDKYVFKTAASMGEAAGVSESTVVRFAYFLGFDGYPDLLNALKEMARKKLTNVQRMNLTSSLQKQDVLDTVLTSDMNNIRDTIENIDHQAFLNVADKLNKIRTLYIIGMRSSTPLSQFLGYYLTFILHDVRIINSSGTNSFEQMINISDQDACIAISFPRYCVQTLEALRVANGRGAYCVAITDTINSPLAKFADECLSATSDMASFVDSLVAPMSVINALIVALSLNSSNNDITNRLDELEKIFNANQVYHDEHNIEE